MAVPILWIWGLATLVSMAGCVRIARRRSDSTGLFVLMALLLGPGAVPLTHLAIPRPERSQGLAVLALLGGFSTSMFLLAQTLLLKYVDLFEGMSLELPVPTHTLVLIMNLFKSGAAGWMILQCLLISPVFACVMGWLKLENADEEQLAIDLVWNWARLFPLLALTGGLVSFLVYALLAPLNQLAGWIGG